MGTTNKEKTIYRTIRKIGGSTSINLPPDYVKARGLKPGQWVKVVYTDEYLKVAPADKEESK